MRNKIELGPEGLESKIAGRLEKKPVYGGNLIQHIYHDYELRTEELPSETKNYLDKIMGRERWIKNK